MSLPDERTVQAADYYVSVFAGRTDAYAIWNGEFWQAIRRPLTGEVVLKSFETGVPLSAYVLAPDGKTHLAVLDIDLDDGLALGYRVVRKLGELGGIGYVGASRRGCHVWIVTHMRLPAIVIRRALKALIHEAGLPDDPKIELRPGQDYLPRTEEGEPSSLGNCIRMPTMPHQTTRKRYVLVSSAGEKLPGRIADMMLAIDLCPDDVIHSLAERGPMPKIGSAPNDLRNPYGKPLASGSVSDMLRDAGVENALPGRLVHCPLHDDRRPSLSILRDDERAICRSPSCVLYNNGRGRGLYEMGTLLPQPTR